MPRPNDHFPISVTIVTPKINIRILGDNFKWNAWHYLGYRENLTHHFVADHKNPSTLGVFQSWKSSNKIMSTKKVRVTRKRTWDGRPSYLTSSVFFGMVSRTRTVCSPFERLRQTNRPQVSELMIKFTKLLYYASDNNSPDVINGTHKLWVVGCNQWLPSIIPAATLCLIMLQKHF